jgi:CubicO group peptidase (beta-lactamase class C family)
MSRTIHPFVVAAVASVACVASTPALQAPVAVDLVQKLESVLTAAARNGFGGAVVVDRDGHVLLSKGYGFANRRERIPFTVETIAPVGSITKSHDMHRWYTFLMQQPAAIRDMVTMPHADESQGVREGYGFAFRLDRAGRPYRMGSSGSDGVFLSYFMWLPQQRTFMYLVGNNGEERVRPVLQAVVDVVQRGAQS